MLNALRSLFSCHCTEDHHFSDIIIDELQDNTPIITNNKAKLQAEIATIKTTVESITNQINTTPQLNTIPNEAQAIDLLITNPSPQPKEPEINIDRGVCQKVSSVSANVESLAPNDPILSPIIDKTSSSHLGKIGKGVHFPTLPHKNNRSSKNIVKGIRDDLMKGLF